MLVQKIVEIAFGKIVKICFLFILSFIKAKE